MTRRVTTITENPTAFAIEESALAKGEVERVFKKLKTILAEIRKTKGVIGFILKNSTLATSDINNAKELNEFAVLASQLFDSSENLFVHIDASEMKSAALEGSKMRILCVSIGENQVSIFMEKSVDYCRVLNRVQPQEDE